MKFIAALEPTPDNVSIFAQGSLAFLKAIHNGNVTELLTMPAPPPQFEALRKKTDELLQTHPTNTELHEVITELDRIQNDYLSAIQPPSR